MIITLLFKHAYPSHLTALVYPFRRILAPFTVLRYILSLSILDVMCSILWSNIIGLHHDKSTSVSNNRMINSEDLLTPGGGIEREIFEVL